jgi:hypothetical protein
VFVLEYSIGCSQFMLFSLNMTHWLEGTASRLSQESPSFRKRECQLIYQYSENRNNIINTFLALYQRALPAKSFAGKEMRIGFDAVKALCNSARR